MTKTKWAMLTVLMCLAVVIGGYVFDIMKPAPKQDDQPVIQQEDTTSRWRNGTQQGKGAVVSAFQSSKNCECDWIDCRKKCCKCEGDCRCLSPCECCQCGK